MIARQLLSTLESVKPIHGGRMALCPAHKDRQNSLSITEKDEKILLHCFAGCETAAIVVALGLRMSDLFADWEPNGHGKQFVAIYDYVDESGALLFQTVRFEPKELKQWQPDGNGGWIWKLDNTRRVLYNPPTVLKAQSVVVVEGGEDVETARRLGFTATCNPHGAGKWRPEYAESLRSKQAVIIADADPQGLAHGHDIAKSLVGLAALVGLIEALPGVPAKGDRYLSYKPTIRQSGIQIVSEWPTIRPETPGATSKRSLLHGRVLSFQVYVQSDMWMQGRGLSKLLTYALDSGDVRE